MRLSIFSPNYAPEPTGIPFYNTGMAVWLRKKLGWDVTVHTGIPHYPWWKIPITYIERDYRNGRADELIDDVLVKRVRHYVPSPPVDALKRMRLDASYLWATWLRSWSERRRPHAILLIAPPFFSGALGLFLSWYWRVPVIYHVQDLQTDAAIELGMIPTWLGGILRTCERLILRRVDLVSTISSEMRNRIAAKGPTRRQLALFPNWADTTNMIPWNGPNKFRNAWPVNDSTPVIMYSGNLGKKQGVDLLLAAAAKIPNCFLVIAGDGVERTELESQAASIPGLRVHFSSLVPLADLREFLSAADIHCIPQRRAASGTVMPSKLLNIMAVGKPVVVTAPNASELTTQVEQAQCGLAVEPDEVNTLAAGLLTLCRDTELRERLGIAGRNYVCTQFGADAVLSRYAAQLMHLTLPPRSHR